MKKTIKKISFLLFGLMIVSCSDSMEEYLESNMLEKQFLESKIGNHVSYDNIVALCKGQNSITRHDTDNSFDINCIVNDDNDTLLYVCGKQEGGWTIYSSDTRVPAIIAQSDEGSFELLMQNENAKAWIESIAEDMRIIKSLDDDKLNFSEEEIERNKSFWSSISSPDRYVKKMLKQNTTRGIGDDIVFEPSGHYELAYSRTYSEVYDSISRLTTTNWHQNYPYNECCPYKVDSLTRAPAGCVAIAGAQMLYFLHNHLGVPETAPSQAYCNSTINAYPNYDWLQYDYNSSIWSQMNSNGYCAAPFIANIGCLLGMMYDDLGGEASVGDLVNVFAAYGITSTYSSYDTNVVRTSLYGGVPILLAAETLQQRINGNGQQTGVHVFIADRYKRTRNVTENCYEWVWDFIPPDGGPLTLVPETYVYTYSSPEITMIGMNWGWDGSYNIPSEWYSLTGDWIKLEYNFNTSRRMIYNFHITNN